MLFTKLRLHGFKSFVDGAEFLIEPGLTGIVGPNGCGKSNLVEALRWVMGENSYKNMRASGMDDVIFSGSGARPARNVAEVSLHIENSDRTAPAAFNTADVLEVTRRIERESGSVYRVNGREVRARDVQLLFADASSGARSPAMVRQGQIGEIISAKPQARRRILEEAAGVAGLYSRRHEAELRLKGAEDNLLRLEDVIQQLAAQSEALKKQAVQAVEYRGLSAEIRRLEALLLLLAHREAEGQLAKIQHQSAAARRDVEDRTMAQARAARDQALAAAALPELREAEARAGAGLQRLVLARQDLDGQEKRAKERSAELHKQIEQIEHDRTREQALVQDADNVLAEIAAQRAQLLEREEGDAARELGIKQIMVRADEANTAAEKALSVAQGDLAQAQAERAQLQSLLREQQGREARFTAELERIQTETAQFPDTGDEEVHLRELAAAVEASVAARAAHEAELAAIEQKVAGLTAREAQERGPLQAAERLAQRLDTEAQTLQRLLVPNPGAPRALLDDVQVRQGYEAAFGAAFGDDLDASLATGAPVHWALTAGSEDPPLPAGVATLANFVQAPAPLQRRLNQIGVVVRADGERLRAALRVGQRLVSVEGDLWRWDGFTAAAHAPNAAAKRLAEKNRLDELLSEAQTARQAAEVVQAAAKNLQNELRAAGEAERLARASARDILSRVERSREAFAVFERKSAQVSARREALAQARKRLSDDLSEAQDKRREAEQGLADSGSMAHLMVGFEQARAAATLARSGLLDARSQIQSFESEKNARARRLAELQREEKSWAERKLGAADQAREFGLRQAGATAELSQLDSASGQFAVRRRALAHEITAAEQHLRDASDLRAAGESELARADCGARAALEAMGSAREEAARQEARRESAQMRLNETLEIISEKMNVAPDELTRLAGVSTEGEWPELRACERQLAGFRAARDRLGAVNLRAETELAEIDARRGAMIKERDDLTEAIRRLRLAIQSLNREGRQRLVAAFDQVNVHFKELFTTLFGGGAAELQLVESEDPLEAGLEILACPPGKKPQTMTLLSGGEQALTAMSLIFAIFLTNPSPICVLDEVDAPLDDANVERFCDLLDEMARRTATRFLTITHNPITMARMSRLFGVTMAERGVSQLVSVDLETAERFAEAS